MTDPLAARANFMTGLALLPDGCRRFLRELPGGVPSGTGFRAQPSGVVSGRSSRPSRRMFRYRRRQLQGARGFASAAVHARGRVTGTFSARCRENVCASAGGHAAGRCLRSASRQRSSRTANRICADFAIALTAQQHNALAYIHGEGETYRKDLRVAGELAAFCHCCDYLSARLWHDQPRRSGRLPDLIS